MVSPIPKTPFISPVSLDKDRDIETRKKQADISVEVVTKSALEFFSSAPTQIKELIRGYIYTDITRIYNTGRIDFVYIPKPTPTSRLPILREVRLLHGEDNILSRLAREFAQAQIAMEKEPEKPFEFVVPKGLLPQAEERGLTDFTAEETRLGDCTVGLCSYIGRRGTMEDTHIIKSFDLTIQGKTHQVPLFGVFDGHGGINAANYVRSQLATVLRNALGAFNLEGLHTEGIWNALKLTCVSLNYSFRSSSPQDTSGTTVLFVIELDGKIWTVSTGDSRAILNNGGTFIQLTVDAQPQEERFRKGIENRGGKVYINRIEGRLGVARAIGDSEFGDKVSARPKITMLPRSFLKPGCDLLLGCDGNFNKCDTFNILKADELHHHLSPSDLARGFVYSSYNAGSSDNLTMMVVRFP